MKQKKDHRAGGLESGPVRAGWGCWASLMERFEKPGFGLILGFPDGRGLEVATSPALSIS